MISTRHKSPSRGQLGFPAVSGTWPGSLTSEEAWQHPSMHRLEFRMKRLIPLLHDLRHISEDHNLRFENRYISNTTKLLKDCT